MPKPTPGESEKDFVSRCIPVVLKDGTAKDEKQAAAICYNLFTGKSIDAHDLTMDVDALKVGARHSAPDQQAVQQMHDLSNQLGAACPQPKGEVYEFALMNADKSLDFEPEDTVIAMGGAVKAVRMDDGKINIHAPLVVFSDPANTDLTGDYFDASTDYGIDEWPSKSTTYFNHGLDAHFKKKRLHPVTLTKDEFAIWADGILDEVDQYEKFIADLAEAGKMGMSSGVPGHLVEREQVGKAMHITTWPLGLDASYTHTPAESRTRNLFTLKSLLSVKTVETGENLEESNMEITEEQFGKVIESVTTKAVEAAVGAAQKYTEAALKALPAIDKGGFAQVTHDEADVPFKSMGDFLGAVKQATLTQGRELAPRLKALNIKALGANELVGSEGGFLLEPTFVAGLLTPLHDTGPFSSRAAKLAIGPNSNGVIIRAIDETSRANGSRWGGILGYRLAEAGTKLPSNPTFSFIEMRLKKFAVLCYATEELLQDTTALAGIIQQGAAEELDFMVNDDILNGPGNAGPLGIMNSGALISVAKETGQAKDTVVTANIFKMWSRMHPRSKANATWYINTDVTPQLYQLSLSVGTGGMPMYMAPGSLPQAPSGALLGRPIVETEFNATLGDKGDIVLADMSQYAMIDRDVQAASSIHVQFLTDQVAYRFVYRCDGRPKMSTPLTPYKGSGNTLSPFVTLDERA